MDYIDNVSTSGISYKYLIQSIYKPESCTQAIPVSKSNIGTSILLESSGDSQIAMLNWTPYEDYSTGLSGYIVQRRSGGGEFIDLVNLGPENTSWQESIESVINGYQPGEVQYKVLAMSMQVDGEDPGISASNIVSVFVETSMKIPNAFTPGRSSNYLFKPVIDFAPSKYRMIIYDRGGRKLFETGDPSEGWDGTFNGGDFAMEGVYVYFIQYTDYTGLSSTLSGNVTVIYPAEY
jgi:gliding motility-associated-like protein